MKDFNLLKSLSSLPSVKVHGQSVWMFKCNDLCNIIHIWECTNP